MKDNTNGLASHYDPAEIEDKWYQHWTEAGYFFSERDDREAYSIVIPPPNVTGVLHMGHMLNNTVQDILARKARLDGKNVCWVPGTDHASIATEAKVVWMLREKGIKKSDIGREQFIEHAWEWTEKYGGIILKQLRKLGASCDWNRTAFTMDEPRSESVIQAFVDLYNRGKLYRAHRMVNWDPEGQTVLSNEEVIYHDETTQLCHVKYPIDGIDRFITIATTRPETIMGDTAIAVHPEDERYADLRGKNAIVPMVNRKVPIIFDDYVDREFGTGALKVTPAHDTNDYEIGKRHNLETIDILNPDGTLNELAQICVGDQREVARKKVIKRLEAENLLVKRENYNHSVGRSERTNALVEPRLSLQWYVDMKSLAKPALEAVESDEIEFFPKRQKNTYRHWMENIRDWCISRQLWWGHRIPAYYCEDEIFVATSREEALQMAREQLGSHVADKDLKQDEDVLDTWFSSWLWPITCFKGFQSKEDLQYYYPTSVLVTGWDIIFLWVARMIMSGYEWQHEMPFKHVYFTGMVRDTQRRKMSKSLGNSPDALELIARFGADGVRFGVLSSSPAGGDLLFEERLCEQGRNFCNKMWNALKLIKGWEIDESIDTPSVNGKAIDWIRDRMQETVSAIESNYAEYRLSDAVMNLYSFIWSDFCSWYLEMIKPPYGEAIDSHTYEQTLEIYSDICILLHPIMPFITEEIWHVLRDREPGQDCMSAAMLKETTFDADALKAMSKTHGVITKIREVRNSNGLKAREPYDLYVEKGDNLLADPVLQELVVKMAYLKEVKVTDKLQAQGTSFLAENEKYLLAFDKQIDKGQEIEKIKKDLAYAEGFLESVRRKLSNDKFVNNAPEKVVENERKKMADGEERLRILKETLASLQN